MNKVRRRAGLGYVVQATDDDGLVRHDTLEQAEAEARRLATLNPGKTFAVLAPLSTAQGRVAVNTESHAVGKNFAPIIPPPRFFAGVPFYPTVLDLRFHP